MSERNIGRTSKQLCSTALATFPFLDCTCSDVSRILWAPGVLGIVTPVPAIFML
jgi:hypothetical protein